MIDFNIQRILVPVDFSPASINALDSAIAMAVRHEATVLLLNVVETDTLLRFPGDAYISEETVHQMTQQQEHELQSLQQSVIERFLVPCEAISTKGIVSEAIIRTSDEHHADIIVMGTHGASGFKAMFIGSNAFKVVKHAGCPVLTIPAEKKWQSFKKILFPVRPIPAALEKYDFVRKIIRKNNATLKILGLATDYEQDVHLLKDLAAQLNEKLKEDEVEASTYFKVGQDMADEVLKIAAVMDTDLIVITATIDASFKEVFVGPYTQHIINNAHYPVLSIKPTQEKGAHAEEVIQHIRESFPKQIPLYH